MLKRIQLKDVIHDLQRQFKPAKVFDTNSKAGHSISSIHFDDRGEYLISSSTEGMMELYNAREGT